MLRFPATTFRAAAIAIPALLATSIAVPAAAQYGSVAFDNGVGYDNFHSRLAPYGTWSNHPRWGEVWHPTRVQRDFRPYYDGHWANTREYGWLWISDESWGDIPYHYGRWVSDPREGWLWVPGYVWGPSWVVWRSGGGNIGWFPMPPGDNYYGDGAYRDNFDNQYGYRDWYGPSFSSNQFLALWIFVGQDHFGDRNFRNYALPQRDYGSFISQTTNTTNYTTINNYVVNRSIDATRLPREASQRFQPVAASSVIGRDAIVTQATVGRQVEQRERQKRPIPANINPAEQRGRTNLNSNVQPQSPNLAPQDAPAIRRNRNQGGNDAGQPDPKTDRTAPVANAPRQNGNQAPQDAQERRGNRNQGRNDVGQANPQTERATAAPVAPAAPLANTPRQNGNQAPQDAQERRGNRNQGSNDTAKPNPQTERATAAPVAPVAPVANAPRQNGNQAPQDAQERRGNGNSDGNRAGQANPRAERGAAADRATTANPATQATPPAPVANTVPTDSNAGLADRRNRGPVPRDAPTQNGKVIVQDAQTPPRVQGNSQVRGNRQGDANNADEKKAAAEKKKADAERGPN